MSNRALQVAITLGDPAGIGPEIIVGSWSEITQNARHAFEADGLRRFVVGRRKWIDRAIRLLDCPLRSCLIQHPDEAPKDPAFIGVLEVGDERLDDFDIRKVSAEGGRLAYESVVAAARLALADQVDAIVTAPLNKVALAAAGYTVPGHTELLAELCGVQNVAMMLYLPPGENVAGEIGLGVIHTTLHTALRNVFDELDEDAIVDKCQLAHNFGAALLSARASKREPAIGVAALNPHAGEDGLFGDEEATLIAPAVARAKAAGFNATGPLPCDTLMHRAASGEFDLVVAMFHDQGHIALKLLGLQRAVNITLGLPIVRTSVAHGTAFDLAWTGKAQSGSMVQAVRCALDLARQKTGLRSPQE